MGLNCEIEHEIALPDAREEEGRICGDAERRRVTGGEEEEGRESNIEDEHDDEINDDDVLDISLTPPVDDVVIDKDDEYETRSDVGTVCVTFDEDNEDNSASKHV